MTVMDELIESWLLSLTANRKAPKTLDVYGDAVRRLARFMAEVDVEEPTRDVIRDYLVMRNSQVAAATVSVEFRALQQFTRWAHGEGEVTTNLMVGMSPPTLPEKSVPVLSVEELSLILKSCDGPDFVDRRDLALVRVFIDTGARLSEVAGLQLVDVDLPGRCVQVVGKGDRERIVAIGTRTVAALDRYKRRRARHRLGADPALWLGVKSGAMTSWGVYQAVRRRAASVGITMHPHQFRHTTAHEWLSAGGAEGDLMSLMGWRSPSMLRRYGASAASLRARQAHERFGLGDKL